MPCNVPGSPDCDDHSSTTINLFIPILLVSVLLVVGTGVILRRFGLLGRRPVTGGGLNDIAPFDNEPNFGEIPKIYDFSMKYDLAEDDSTSWATLLPVSAYHIDEHQGISKPAQNGNPAPSNLRQAPLAFRLRRFWKPKSSDPSLNESSGTENSPGSDLRPISTSVLIAMPSSGHVLPNLESEHLPDVVLAITEVPVTPSPNRPQAKEVDEAR
ncbi:hypothetical protein FRB90_012206 [Tulasnella sp. 427]|nr:hypothetical protein FRB90_012206 [Tulasnella sp. 427]